MELVIESTSFTSHLLVELLEVFFSAASLSVARFQKLCMGCLPLVLYLVGIFAVVLGIQDGSESRTAEESKVKAPGRGEEEPRLGRGDVEIVMERMGLGCSSDGERLREVVGAADLNGLFDEKEPSLEEMKEAFSVFDQNGDGYIDTEELQRVLSILGFQEGSTPGQCQRMIGTYDENQDGRIDFHEFVKFMECSFC